MARTPQIPPLAPSRFDAQRAAEQDVLLREVDEAVRKAEAEEQEAKKAVTDQRSGIVTFVTESYQNDTLVENAALTANLVELFELRFDPEHERDEVAEKGMREAILAALDKVESLDHDRILRNQLGLIEATLRLDVLSPRSAGEDAWRTALAVSETADAFAAGGHALTREEVAHFLLDSSTHRGSILRCLAMARDNARAVRTALSREAWQAINGAWLIFDQRMTRLDPTATLNAVDAVKARPLAATGIVAQFAAMPAVPVFVSR